MIIAVDGEAASGKGTASKLLAKKFNLTYLDTGLLYRAIGYISEQRGGLKNKEAVIEIAKKINYKDLENYNLRNNEIAILASQVALIPEVREALFNFQINFVNNIPITANGAILDGRDIGSVICPKADIKFYVCAKIEERARRRYKQLIEENPNIKYAEILQSLVERDENDKNRTHGALKKVEDAIEIDNTYLDIQQTFHIMCEYIERKIEKNSCTFLKK